MPSFSEIKEETDYSTTIKKYINQLHEKNNRNIVAYYSGFLTKSSHLPVSINDNDKNGFTIMCNDLDPYKGLDLILHTPGGSIAATESIIDYLNSYFNGDIRAIIPQLAMSGGTMIACSCKEIVMGKQSSLGPVDPQINGIPAHGVISEFKRISEEIDKNPSRIQLWNPILSQYNPTFIGTCEKAIEWSNDILETSLKNNMFKENPRDKKIPKIIETLGTPNDTKHHSRHLNPFKCEELGLNISLMEDTKDEQDIILSIHHACINQLESTNTYKIFANQNEVLSYSFK